MAKRLPERGEPTGGPSARLSRSERWGWWLLAPLLVTPGALAWAPGDAVFGRWGDTARLVAVLYLAVVAVGGLVLWRASKQR